MDAALGSQGKHRPSSSDSWTCALTFFLHCLYKVILSRCSARRRRCTSCRSTASSSARFSASSTSSSCFPATAATAAVDVGRDSAALRYAAGVSTSFGGRGVGVSTCSAAPRVLESATLRCASLFHFKAASQTAASTSFARAETLRFSIYCPPSHNVLHSKLQPYSS